MSTVELSHSVCNVTVPQERVLSVPVQYVNQPEFENVIQRTRYVRRNNEWNKK